MEYIIGNSVGLIQILVGHPLDTIKVNLQNNNNNKVQLKYLYNGIKYPIIQSCITNSLLFGNYNNLKKCGYNPVISGSISGFLTSFIINPFEVLKVRNQNIKNVNYNLQYFSGLKFTILRETLASGIYFGTFEFMHHDLKCNILLSGGMAGVNSWILTYPIDTLKTLVQINNNINYNQIKFTQLFRGLNYALCRAFMVNSIGFYIYSKLENKYLDKKMLT
jgi:solute carrier family 25 (mitochondrial carnitine/acylcarnitine transporter), member 20/29